MSQPKADWRHDGESAVIREMILRARESPQHVESRTAKVGYTPLHCDVCHQPIPSWTSYRLTCYIEDGEPQFVQHHIICLEAPL